MNPAPQLLWIALVVACSALSPVDCAVAQSLGRPVAPGSAARAAAAQDQARPYGLTIWHDDYPVPLELPNRARPRLYERSRRQALESVVANLSGNTSREAWQMAMDFFARAPEDAAELLIQAMDRAFGQPALIDVVKNTIEAMGQMGLPQFDDALRRALEHPSPVVRQAVYASLVRSGSAETVRLTYSAFLPGMDGRARKSWLHAARMRLGKEAVGMFAKLMVPEVPLVVRDLVVQEALKMDPADASVVFEGLWPDAKDEFKALIAGVMHASGRASGSLWLRNALDDDDPRAVVHALRQLVAGGPGPLMDHVLGLSNHPRAEVRWELAKLLTRVPGESATRTLEVLAAPEEALETRKVALRELTSRGRTDSADFLLDEVGTATGTLLQLKLDLLAASGDPRAVPLFSRRFLATPMAEGRSFLQALAFCGAPNAAEALIELFLAEDRPVAGERPSGGQLTTVNYIPILLPNLRGSEAQLVASWARISGDDHVRRSLYLQVLIGIAADREDPAVVEPIVELVRNVLLDPDELPQLRVQALNSLTRKFLDLDDAMRLKRMQEPIGDRETPAMRALLKDFLFEYF